MRSAIHSGASFSGESYDPKIDRTRLTLQLERIRTYALAAGWLTLCEMKTALELIHAPAIFPESSVSAQLRNLRRKPHCYRLIKRRRVGVRGPGAGIWEYRLLPPEAQSQVELFDAQPPPELRVDAGVEPDDGSGREAFLRELRRIGSVTSK